MSTPTVPNRTVTYPRGSYLCVRGHGFVAWAIRMMTQSRYNHAAIVIATDEVVEAKPSGAAIGTVSQYKNLLQVANDDEPLTDEQRDEICKQALDLVGTPYGFLDIFSLALIQFGIRWWWVVRRITSRKEMICSQLVDEAYLRAGVHLFDDGRLPQDVTPGDLADRIARRTWLT